MMEESTTFEKWFWNEKFWLPVNVTWSDFKGDESTFIPTIHDLWVAFPIGIGLFLLRLVWERFIGLPIGRFCNLKESPPQQPVTQPTLEEAYKIHRRVLPDHHAIEKLGKDVDWSPRQVERWWRRRRVQGKPSEMQRFKETSWRFLFYLLMFWYGIAVLWDKFWFWDMKYCWTGYPRQHVSTEIWAYYMIELGFYFSLLLSLFMDIRRKDFVEQVFHHVITVTLLLLSAAVNMLRGGAVVLLVHDTVDFWMEDFLEQLVHHFCTISLMLFSYTTNMMRVGAIVLLVHDAADPWLEGAKLAKYAKLHKLCDTMFVVFTIVWFVTRLCILPLRILHCTMVESYGLFGIFGAYKVFNGMLLTLQALHIFWFYLILRMLHRYVIHGQVEKDERSDTEPETNSEDEELVESKPGEQANGIENHFTANNNVKAKKIN